MSLTRYTDGEDWYDKRTDYFDGGMGHEPIDEVRRQGLWSAKALIDKPESVRAVHQDYIDAEAGHYHEFVLHDSQLLGQREYAIALY